MRGGAAEGRNWWEAAGPGSLLDKFGNVSSSEKWLNPFYTLSPWAQPCSTCLSRHSAGQRGLEGQPAREAGGAELGWASELFGPQMARTKKAWSSTSRFALQAVGCHRTPSARALPLSGIGSSFCLERA